MTEEQFKKYNNLKREVEKLKSKSEDARAWISSDFMLILETPYRKKGVFTRDFMEEIEALESFVAFMTTIKEKIEIKIKSLEEEMEEI